MSNFTKKTTCFDRMNSSMVCSRRVIELAREPKTSQRFEKLRFGGQTFPFLKGSSNIEPSSSIDNVFHQKKWMQHHVQHSIASCNCMVFGIGSWLRTEL